MILRVERGLRNACHQMGTSWSWCLLFLSKCPMQKEFSDYILNFAHRLRILILIKDWVLGFIRFVSSERSVKLIGTSHWSTP